MPSCNDSTVIRLSNVSVDFGARPVLSDVNLEIRRGDFIAITGPNGGGKTTLLRIILKLLKPNSGSVEYFSPDCHKVKRLPIGYLPQKSRIDSRFPIAVGEVIRSGLLSGRCSCFKKTEDEGERYRSIINLVGMEQMADRPIGELSGGQLQRTLIGRAIISEPEIIVLDEPLSYVDKEFERQIYRLMEDISRHSTVILVSHEMTYISTMASRHLIVDHKLHECSGHHHFMETDCD